MWNRLPRIPNPIHSGVSVEQSLKFRSTKNQKNLSKEGWMDGRERWVVVLTD